MEASPHLNPKRGPFSGSRLLQAQPDGVLCRLAQRGNPAAFEALYNRHHGALYGFVFHLLGRGASAEDAEDIAQESFSTAFSKLADRREDGSFKSWLFTIARNRAFDHMRAGRPPTADVTELPLAAAGGPERQLESKAEMAWLMTALGDLPERQREALVMREMGGLSYDEIAVGMETTVPGVKQLINRARGTLNDAADVSELRPRRLRKELAALVPVLPLATVSAGVAAFGVASTGAGAGVAAGAGGISAATKVAAVALTVAAIGGGAAGLTSSTGAGDDARTTAGQSVAGDATDNLSGSDDGSGGEGRGGSGSDGRSGDDDGEDRTGRRRDDDLNDDRGRERRDDSGDDSEEPHRRGSSDGSARGEDDPPEPGDDHSGSGSGSGDDSPEAPEPVEPDEPEIDEPDEVRSGSGSASGGESQSSGGDSSPELPED